MTYLLILYISHTPYILYVSQYIPHPDSNVPWGREPLLHNDLPLNSWQLCFHLPLGLPPWQASFHLSFLSSYLFIILSFHHRISFSSLIYHLVSTVFFVRPMILKDILIPFMNFILSLYHLIFISTYLFSSLLSCQANDWERHPNPIHEHYLFSLSSYPFIILSFHHYFLVRPMIGKDIPIPYMNIAVSLVSFTVPLLLGIAFKRKWPKKALALSKRVIQH